MNTELVYYVQDVIVAPDHQRRGIGTRMMDKVMAYVGAHARHNSIVGLMAAKGKEPFYLRYGFAPMTTLKRWMVRASQVPSIKKEHRTCS